ncbi:putative thiamine pyrophosphokinase, partial [Mollisia scopiformis]
KSNLQIIKDCDNFPYDVPGERERYAALISSLWTFHLPNDPRPHGYILDSVVQKMPWTKDFHLDPTMKEVHLLQPAGESWQAECSLAIDALLDLARLINVFPKLGAERDEQFSIIGAQFPIGVERSASSLLGIIGRGVHMTVYTKTPSGIKFWIARRNLTKHAYAGKLDNAVAGGIALGEDPLECLIREAEEETGMSEELVRGHVKAAGNISWLYISDTQAGGELGLMNAGISYVYDLEVGGEIVLKPVDGDVHEFLLMDVEDVQEAMRNGEFKCVCANVMMDFFIRHRFITEENEEDYGELVRKLHRELPFPTGSA